jgi:hypothetical protein
MRAAGRMLGSLLLGGVVVLGSILLFRKGLLPLIDTDRSLAWAADAIGEPVTAIHPRATRTEVVNALSEPGVSRLAVQERPEWFPEGVITDIDLADTVGNRA